MPAESEAAREAMAEDYAAVFGTEAGQRVLMDLAKFCGLASAGYADAPLVDSHAVMALEGKRRVVLRILGLLNMPPIDLIGQQLLADRGRLERRARAHSAQDDTAANIEEYDLRGDM